MTRCPFCEFDRSQKYPDPDYSHVQALRELAVHIVFAHREEFDELGQTVGGEWSRPLPENRAEPSR